ncbi:glycerophosphodiester phosphodiesterase family protein [Halioxenophilus sp. WMMB6]|uniref:glycerophosphodiester phosphodiesterase family protein n=1 Tax=Halioxenophilus sp. WMMB6 TaxID=3073815 RepID=UPI00295E797B|nr:glycerophosphodiester phosphodiesterase family protein [Halioxenophilus sp. WMMB6]
MQKAQKVAHRLAITLLLVCTMQTAYGGNKATPEQHNNIPADLGPRPFYLVDGMDDGELKEKLEACKNQPFYRTPFSIGHRGAAAQFPEHTRESYIAGASMGAGILECDVTFTADGELVCRHAQCDLHTTTNILTTELNSHCTQPWDPNNPNPDTVKCCASDLTLAEFKSLKGKMDSFDPTATSAEAYQGGVPDWRTQLYDARGTLMTHKESIELFQQLGVEFTPELKVGDPGAKTTIDDVFGSQQAYAQKMVDDYIAAGVNPNQVWPQSFNLDDIHYWIAKAPKFGKQAVFLDERYENGLNPNDASTFQPSMQALAEAGVNIIAPPIPLLLRVTDDGDIVPSVYAAKAREAGLKIITWTLERSDLRRGSRTGSDAEGRPQTTFYYGFDINPLAQAVNKDSDQYKVLDALAQKVGVIGVFSDWPATTTYYANCMNLK